ncbi:unnamed protein product [Caenorhabditis auriculariae]|uniref:Uncharacterized protein n=1 Tax=Caenorhabditis auriculariae TaxID=2777116 RepID=A0A8S1HI18_9PELO|nr:unnamed protein product [Caenorhabditis auriculariae]
MRVHGVVVLVGGCDDLGLEMCRTIVGSHRVSRLYVACRNLDLAQELRAIEDPGKKLRIVECDVTRDWSIQNAVKLINCGKINCLILNTSSNQANGEDTVEKAKRDTWQRNFDVNVSSVSVLLKETLPLLKAALKENEVVTVASICSLSASLRLPIQTKDVSFACSQAALHQLIRIFSTENPRMTVVSIAAGFGLTIRTLHSVQIAREVLRVVDKVSEDQSGALIDHTGARINF